MGRRSELSGEVHKRAGQRQRRRRQTLSGEIRREIRRAYQPSALSYARLLAELLKRAGEKIESYALQLKDFTKGKNRKDWEKFLGRLQSQKSKLSSSGLPASIKARLDHLIVPLERQVLAKIEILVLSESYDLSAWKPREILFVICIVILVFLLIGTRL